MIEVVDDGTGGADTELGSACAVSPTVSKRSKASFVSGARRWRHAAESGDPVRVVIAEDSVLLREGLERLLSESGPRWEGETAEDLLLKVRSYSPDVAIVDIRLPPTHNDEGLRAALEIRALHPSVGVLVLSQYVEVGLAMKLPRRLRRGSGVPAQGSHRRRQGVHRRRSARRERRFGDRPDHRLDAALQASER